MEATVPNQTQQTIAGSSTPSAADVALRERLRKPPVQQAVPMARIPGTGGIARTVPRAVPAVAAEDMPARPVPGEIFAVNKPAIANYDGEGPQWPAFAPVPAPAPKLTPPPPPPPPAVQAQPPTPVQAQPPPPPPQPSKPFALPVTLPLSRPEPPKPPPVTFQNGDSEAGYNRLKRAMAVLSVLVLLIGIGLLVYVNHEVHQQAANLSAAELRSQAGQESATTSQSSLDEAAVGDLKAKTAAITGTLQVTGGINTDGMYKVKGVQIASADLSDASNLVRLNGSQAFTGVNTFSNSHNTFVGNGAGLTGITATTLNSHNGSFYQDASNLNAGTLPIARLPADVMLQSSSPSLANYLQNGGDAAVNNLTVGGTANFAGLNVSGTAGVHDLTVTGTATIATLHVTGNASFDGSTVAFSSNVRGINQPIGNGAVSVNISFGTAHPDANYATQCTPSYNTTCYITAKTTTGFTINFGTAPSNSSQTVDWLVVR